MRVRQFIIDRWFLIVLAGVLAGGITQWEILMPLAEARWLRNSVVATVLFLMALPLPAEATWRALRRPAAPLLGFAVNYGFLPLAAWGISFALRADTAAGLLVAAATPCTLASAAVWTRRAGGNDAVALFVTVLTNALCFLLTPLWLTLTLGSRAEGVTIDAGEMVGELALLVVLPMAVGQLVRLYRPLGTWATRRGKSLSTAAQCGILTMVLMGAIKTGEMLHEQPAETAFSWWDWIEMIAATLGLHLAMLAGGVLLAGVLRLPPEDRIAVGISGSQKTLMVGLQVALACKLLILPMVVYHVGQLIVDTIIADRWRRAREGTTLVPEPGPETT
jgi:sodium/bile acid cotransporter 7